MMYQESEYSVFQVPPVMVTAPLTTQQPLIHSPSADLASPKLKKKKLKLDEKEVAALTNTPQSVFSTNIVGMFLVLDYFSVKKSYKRKYFRWSTCAPATNPGDSDHNRDSSRLQETEESTVSTGWSIINSTCSD